MLQDFDIFGSLWTMFLIFAVLYVYFGFVITRLARKTSTPGAWMAWVPFANFVLLCRVGRKSDAYVLLMLIPMVNIVALVIVWMAVAKACGKPPLLGLLMLVPGVNLLVPLLMLAGPVTASKPGVPRAPGPMADTSAFSAVCPACGRAECVGEAFCGYTGRPIASGPVPNPQPTVEPSLQSVGPAAAGSGATAGLALGALVLIGGLGYWALTGGGPKGPTAIQGQLPQRMAGTLKEFPVDTAAKPAKPVTVTARNLKTGKGKLPPKSLPPGITDASLAQLANTATTATYQSGAGDPPVNVHVLDTTGNGPQSQELASAVASAAGSGAQTTGVHVASPSGGEYDGFKVRTPGSVTYVLDKAGAAVVILVYAADAAGIPIADRLAANIGNGQGLIDDPETSGSIASLPGQLPPGVELVETSTYSAESMAGSLDQLKTSIGADFGNDAIQWIEKIRPLIPPRLTSAKYRDAAGKDLNLLVGDYGGTFRAWTTWMMLRGTAGLTGMSSAAITGGDAMSTVSDGTEYVVFRKGGSLGVTSGPPGGLARRLAEATMKRPNRRLGTVTATKPGAAAHRPATSPAKGRSSIRRVSLAACLPRRQ